jgi:hypothetical protein
MKSNLANNKFVCDCDQVIRTSDDINIGGISGLFNKTCQFSSGLPKGNKIGFFQPLNTPVGNRESRIDKRIELLEMFLPVEFINEYADRLSVREVRCRKLTTAETVQFSVAQALLGTGLRTTMPAIMLGAGLQNPELGGHFLDHKAYIYRKKKVGHKLPEELLKALPKPTISKEANSSAWYKDFHIRIFDGMKRDVFASEKNWKYFGSMRQDASYPQLLTVAAIDGGEHLPLGIKYAPVKKGSKGEPSLANEILVELPQFNEPTLWLGDRNFSSYRLFDEISRRGEDFCMRASKSWKFGNVIEKLPDDSFLFLAKDWRKIGKRKKEPMTLRGMKYAVIKIDEETGKEVGEEYYLITSLLDHEKYPACELIDLYPKRWEVEIAFDEVLNGIFRGEEMLRSKTPETVLFELYSLWIAYYVIRMLIIQSKELAAADKGNGENKTEELMQSNVGKNIKKQN